MMLSARVQILLIRDISSINRIQKKLLERDMPLRVPFLFRMRHPSVATRHLPQRGGVAEGRGGVIEEQKLT
jgi:hypothetical protein